MLTKGYIFRGPPRPLWVLMHNQPRTQHTNGAPALSGFRGRRVRQRRGSAPVREMRLELENLRREEAVLQEELRQLRAAVQIYNEVVNTLAARAGAANTMGQRAA